VVKSGTDLGTREGGDSGRRLQLAVAQAAAARGSASSGCSRWSATGDGHSRAEAEWCAGARQLDVERNGQVDDWSGVGGGPASVRRRWKLWLLGMKDELLLPRRIEYRVSSATDGGSL
jgi:hypothetical protein